MISEILCINSPIISSVIEGGCTIIAVFIGAFVAYKYAVKQLKKDVFISIEREYYNAKRDALQKCWSLMAYLTLVENEKSVVIFERDDPAKDYICFFRKSNGESFIKALSVHFYENGHGIYLSKEIKNLLFEYRAILYGFLLKERENPNDVVQIKNTAMVDRMKAIQEELILLFHKELKVEVKDLK